MALDFSGIHWLAVLISFIAGQAISTVWFVLLFGEPWAKEYGASSRQEHTSAVPGYTYAVQALCTLVLVISMALLQEWLFVDTMGEALWLGVFVAVGLVVANGIPGQAFLRRWRVAGIAFGCQSVMVMAISLTLGLWQ